MFIAVTHCTTTSKESACRMICILRQQTSEKRWFTNVNVTSNFDVPNSVYPVTMTTIRHCSILGFGRGHTIKQVAPGITRPLHATALSELSMNDLGVCIVLENNLPKATHFVRLQIWGDSLCYTVSNYLEFRHLRPISRRLINPKFNHCSKKLT